jgi:hypothetical protein
MKKSFYYIVILFLGLSGCIVYFSQRSSLKIPILINNFWNDFIVLPAVLAIALFVVRMIHKKPKALLSAFVILSVVILYSIVFEIYLPKTHTRYTSDGFDVLAYATGGAFFYYFQRLSL